MKRAQRHLDQYKCLVPALWTPSVPEATETDAQIRYSSIALVISSSSEAPSLCPISSSAGLICAGAEDRRGLCSESKRRRVKPDGFDTILSIPDVIYAPGVDDDAETAFDVRSGALISWR